jgi:hypothetical protein
MGLGNIILDPGEVAIEGRTELPLEGGGISVYYEGLDFGDQEIRAYMAEGLFGSTPIDHDWPLRTIKIPLVIRKYGTETFDDIRAKLEAKVARINEDGGGWLKRVLPSGRHIFADLVEAKLHLSASWLAENRNIDREATLELQALPDFYGDAVVESGHEFTGDGAFTMLVGGELPARVANMRVEDKSGNAQLGLMWHVRRRHYSSANTAEWAYNAEALGLLDIAEKVTLAGSYGTKVVKHPKLSTGWTPILSTNKTGTIFLTHAGLYSVWTRVYSASEHLPWLRLVYAAGDIVAPQENMQVRVPGKESYYLVNLGQINIPALPFGAQRWEGVVQARGESGGENISIDRLWFKCDDECSGVLGALRSATALSTLDASDSLLGSGALKESEANRGGKWEEFGGTEGFTRSAEGARREHISDSEGRTAVLAGSTVGAVIASLELGRSGAAVGLVQGLYLRWFSSTFWVRVVIKPEGSLSSVSIQYAIGGSPVEVPLISGLSGAPFALEAELTAAGGVVVKINSSFSIGITLPATFKKGEAHSEGKIGTYDFNPSSTPVTRTYRRLLAWAPAPEDTVMYPNKSAFLSTDGMYRESSDGVGAGPIGQPGTDLPRLPVSGPEKAPVEIAFKPSRGQFGEASDAGKDAFKVQVSYHPCFPTIPAS